MEKKELTCIGCPLGCSVMVHMEEGNVIDITGYTCPRGRIYAENEVTNPKRTVTTTVRVAGGKERLVSVKTKEDIPKEKIQACIQALESITVDAPILIGDIIVENVAFTGVAVVATKNVKVSQVTC